VAGTTGVLALHTADPAGVDTIDALSGCADVLPVRNPDRSLPEQFFTSTVLLPTLRSCLCVLVIGRSIGRRDLVLGRRVDDPAGGRSTGSRRPPVGCRTGCVPPRCADRSAGAVRTRDSLGAPMKASGLLREFPDFPDFEVSQASGS